MKLSKPRTLSQGLLLRAQTTEEWNTNRAAVCLFTCFGGAAFRDTMFFPTTDLKHSDPRPATHRYPTRLQVAVAKHQVFIRVMREEPSRALHNHNKNNNKKNKKKTPPYRSEWAVVAKSGRYRGEVSAPRPNRPDPGPEGPGTHRQQRHHICCSPGFTGLISEPSRSGEQTVSCDGKALSQRLHIISRDFDSGYKSTRERFQTWSILGLDSVLCLARLRST